MAGVKAAKLLLQSGSISQYVIVMFDEMYLQKSQEYVGGELRGANENVMLCKSVLCFMIVGLQNNIPFIVRTVPVNKLESDSLKEEILNTIELLHSCSYKVMLDIVLVFLTIVFITLSKITSLTFSTLPLRLTARPKTPCYIANIVGANNGREKIYSILYKLTVNANLSILCKLHNNYFD